MKQLLIYSLIAIGVSFMQAGESFVVNTVMDSTQRDAQVARDKDGNYVIVWQNVSADDAGNITMQCFNASDEKIGSQKTVNTRISGEQEKLAVDMNDDGDFVVVWASHNGVDSVYDIHGRYFKDGQFTGGDFLVNSTIAHSQTNPDVAIYNDGSFIITWESWFEDGSDRGVYARRFDATGQPVDEAFLVNGTTQFSQARPAIETFADGRFIIIWESWYQDVATETGYGIFARLFNTNASPVDEEFQVNTYTNDYQWFGDVCVLDDIHFVVTWTSWRQDGSKGGIYWQKFDTDGNRIGPEVPVNMTTYHYQWLPRVRTLGEDKLVIVWSSWGQDGSRDGIYARSFNPSGESQSLETRLNDYTDNYQWEPDVISGQDDSFLTVWSSWGQFNMDYEVMAKRTQLDKPVGFFSGRHYEHLQGKTTADFKVHVMDSSQLNGHNYELSFTDVAENSFSAQIKDMDTGAMPVSGFVVDDGEDVFYQTPMFDGIIVQINPEYDFEVDYENSYFKNNSGTNLMFDIGLPTVGTAILAPIDVALIWAETDTLQDGSYQFPADTALGYYGNVQTPFRAINLLNDESLDLFVVEKSNSKNERWDIGEKIDIITPPPYQEIASNTHIEISSQAPEGGIVWPSMGDTNFVYTTRPVTENDVFRFSTAGSFVTGLENEKPMMAETFKLLQNYPNPFNPTTTIPYYLPRNTSVQLTIYNVLGQKVKQLVDGYQKAGHYKILFDGSGLASGVYFYHLRAENVQITKKMLIMR
ncbi:MAG: T9SS type A sorting domain-containing protein [Caldithrix sp.]|nr:T9SS type A sorting domain-containing protein [Caldithrix sp.]